MSRTLRTRSLRVALLLGCASTAMLAWAQPTSVISINKTGLAPAATSKALLELVAGANPALGLLIPRMASTASIVAPTQGLTVYQTGGTPGFYVYEGGGWQRIAVSTGGGGWVLAGNAVPAPAPDPSFLGPTNNQPLVFRTGSPATERMRISNTNGYVGVGTNAPTQRLDVAGGLRLFNPGTSSAENGRGTNSWVYNAAANQNSGWIQSISDGQGTLMYQNFPLRTGSTATWASDTVLWDGPWGNTTGTGVVNFPGTTTTTPEAGGWKRLPNGYTEQRNSAWTHHANVICAGAGSMTLPSSGSGTSSALVSPFRAGGHFIRQQYLFLASELDAERSQATWGEPAPHGLCAGQPVTSISMLVDAGTGSSTSNYALTVKHVPSSLTSLDNVALAPSPDQSCVFATSASTQPAVTNGWLTFTLSSPFIWDGHSNVVVEFASYKIGGTAVPVIAYDPPGPGNRTATLQSTNALCTGLTGAATNCAPAVAAANLQPQSCGGTPSASSSPLRPVMRFTGQVSSLDPSAVTSGNGDYLRMHGGLIMENPSGTGLPWGRNRVPYAFKGPGTISAEKGVFDDGVQLNDHVFDRAFAGQVHPRDAEQFGTDRTLAIADMAEHTRAHRHLPTIQGRNDWEASGGFSLGSLTNQLWTTAETHALYITELHDRLNLLELLSNERPLLAEEASKAHALLVRQPELSDAEKAALSNAITHRAQPSHNAR